MANRMSKTKIDRLGDRLKKGEITDDDLRLLDTYRVDFSEAFDIVAAAISEKLAVEPTARPAKSTTAISDKLRRESIRLSQIQDIAGCRLIVEDIGVQDSTVELLKTFFENVTVVDRRKQPSHGYRAVHVIVNCLGKSIEIQIRTQLQDMWAEFSEKLSDFSDRAIKYGGGAPVIQDLLSETSEMVAQHEFLEVQFASDFPLLPPWHIDQLDESEDDDEELVQNRQKNLEHFRMRLRRIRLEIYQQLHRVKVRAEELKEGKVDNDIFD